VEIRPAIDSDFEALVELDLSSAAHHAGLDPGLYHVPDRAAVASFLRERLADPDREVFVAVADGAVVGMVDVTIAEDPPPGSILRPIRTADLGISVLAGWRGRGVGHALMAVAEASARRRGAERLALDMASSNAGALRFYEGLGYATYGLVMRKAIEPGV
jgi:ribosomal protein S18 acetylase RimI-like enzyme